jgi:hypothetical protein
MQVSTMHAQEKCGKIGLYEIRFRPEANAEAVEIWKLAMSNTNTKEQPVQKDGMLEHMKRNYFLARNGEGVGPLGM